MAALTRLGQVCRRWPVTTSVAGAQRQPCRAASPPVNWRLRADRFRRPSRPVASGCPGPVNQHAHDGTHKCGSHRDQGDLPARHAAGDADEGVGRGPESDDLGGRAGRRAWPGGRDGGGRGRDGRRQGAASPVSRPARRPMVRMGFMAAFFAVWFAVSGGVALRDRWRVTGGGRQRPVLVAGAGVCGRGRVQRGRSRVIQGAWISTVRRVA
jgi:hypothetical protein